MESRRVLFRSAFTQPGFSNASGNVTNNGYDSSTGIGVRLGYMGKFGDQVTVGASYSPKIKMGKFDRYAGLFADSGSFDIPENYTLGVAIKATPSVSLALDYQRINYGGVRSIANPSTNIGGCMMGNPANCLGGSDGAGFGWSNVNVWKIGAQWQATPQWNLRAGFNRTDNPIEARDVTFNIIAPGVTTNHYTLGATYTPRPLDLTGNQKVDDAVDAIFVVGPKTAFKPDELKAIDQFLMQGKAAAFFLDVLQ